MGNRMGMCILFVVIGAIFGGIVGELLCDAGILSDTMLCLVRTRPVFEMPPLMVDLYVIRLTFGMAVVPNFMSVLGMILGLILFRRY